MTDYKMKKIISKRGEGAIGMSFGWIFSLILVGVFIFTAIFGIKFFINMSGSSTISMFYEDLQSRIDEAYRSSSADFEFSVNLPGITKICFANSTAKVTGDKEAFYIIERYSANSNVFLFPSGKAHNKPYKTLNRLNISATTERENPLCFDVAGGGKIRIVKGIYDRDVIIK